MTRNWRIEALALLSLWAAATALLLFAARIPHRPVLVPSLGHPAVLLRAPLRRAPVARPAAARAAVGTPVRAAASAEPAGSDRAVEAPVPRVEVMEFGGIDIVGYSGEGEPDEYAPHRHHYYRWQYRSRRPYARWTRSWPMRRGRALRLAASAFFADGPVAAGASGDPCAVFPGACSAARGGVFDPPTPAEAPARAPALARRVYGAPATVTRDGDRWRLANEQFTLDVDALCQLTARRADEPAPSVATFAPPAPAPCVVRETAAPWDDRDGAAIELTWTAPGGSMRAVVALADDGDAAEASAARTDASGETWLANLGTVPLTWTVGGSPVTVAPGGAVQVTVSERASGGGAGAARAPPGARSSSRS